MSSKYILVACLALAIAVTAISAGKIGEGKNGGGKKMGKSRHMHKHNMTCKGESLKMKEMHGDNAKKECMKELFPAQASTTASSNPDGKVDKKAMHKMHKEIHNNQCFHVCMMKKQGIIKADGSYNADGTNTFIKSVFPESVQASLKTAIDSCNSANGKTFSMDNKCEGYKLFNECKIKNVMEICEIKNHHHDQKDAAEHESASGSGSSEQ